MRELRIWLGGVGLAALVAALVPAASAGPLTPQIEAFSLADRGNLKRLPNGDFLFRLGREINTGTTYWAYQGNSKFIIAIVDPGTTVDTETVRILSLAIADLPKRTGCSTGLVHRSRIVLVPEQYTYDPSAGRGGFGPALAEAEVENDKSGQTPTRLLEFRLGTVSEQRR